MSINRNVALGTSFLLEIPLFPELNYFVQNAELPSITMGGVDTPYKNHQGILPSNRIDFDPLNLTFLVDEEYENWYSLVCWFERIRTGRGAILDEMSDITLHLVNSNKNFNKEIIFRSAFPSFVGSLPLDSGSVDADPVICSATFRYQYFEMVKSA